MKRKIKLTNKLGQWWHIFLSSRAKGKLKKGKDRAKKKGQSEKPAWKKCWVKNKMMLRGICWRKAVGIIAIQAHKYCCAKPPSLPSYVYIFLGAIQDQTADLISFIWSHLNSYHARSAWASFLYCWEAIAFLKIHSLFGQNENKQNRSFELQIGPKIWFHIILKFLQSRLKLPSL